MKKIFIAFTQGRVTYKQMLRCQKLHKNVFKSNMLVEYVDSPEWRELTSLMKKVNTEFDPRLN